MHSHEPRKITTKQFSPGVGPRPDWGSLSLAACAVKIDPEELAKLSVQARDIFRTSYGLPSDVRMGAARLTGELYKLATKHDYSVTRPDDQYFRIATLGTVLRGLFSVALKDKLISKEQSFFARELSDALRSGVAVVLVHGPAIKEPHRGVYAQRGMQELRALGLDWERRIVASGTEFKELCASRVPESIQSYLDQSEAKHEGEGVLQPLNSSLASFFSSLKPMLRNLWFPEAKPEIKGPVPLKLCFWAGASVTVTFFTAYKVIDWAFFEATWKIGIPYSIGFLVGLLGCVTIVRETDRYTDRISMKTKRPIKPKDSGSQTDQGDDQDERDDFWNR